MKNIIEKEYESVTDARNAFFSKVQYLNQEKELSGKILNGNISVHKNKVILESNHLSKNELYNYLNSK